MIRKCRLALITLDDGHNSKKVLDGCMVEKENPFRLNSLVQQEPPERGDSFPSQAPSVRTVTLSGPLLSTSTNGL